MDTQYLIIAIVIAAAVVSAAWHIYKVFSSPDDPCSNCSSCCGKRQANTSKTENPSCCEKK